MTADGGLTRDGALRIAVVAPAFFGYPERIAEALRARGNVAVWHDERPSNQVLAKLALRLAPGAAAGRALRRHHAALTDAIVASGATDALLISPQAFPAAEMARLRAAGLRVTLYLWDSLGNRGNVRRLLAEADTTASFDRADCARHGLLHLPLFGLAPATPPGEDAPPVLPPDNPRPVDFLFCATLHSTRPRWLHRITQIAARRGWRLETMGFYHSRPLWLIRNAAAPHLWPQVRRLRTKPFAASEVAQAMARARVVIDVPHPRQSGLPMRVFEALSAGATVLSTGEQGAEGLPDGLRHRVLSLPDAERTEAVMEAALRAVPSRLSAEDREAISIGRFAARLEALMREA